MRKIIPAFFTSFLFIFFLSSSIPHSEAAQPAAIPEFSLTDQEGRTVQWSDFRGKAVLLSFIYTRCPMPTMCPLVTAKMTAIQKMINQTDQERVQLVSVTFDPAYDQPSVLKEYALLHHADLENWAFLTGEKEAIETLTQHVNLIYEDAGNGDIGHNMKTLLVDAEGKVLQIYSGSGWEVDQVLKALTDLSRKLRK